MPSVRGQQTNWILPAGQSGDWSQASNWSNGVPASYAYIANGGTVTVSLPGEVCGSLYVGEAGDGNSGTIQMTGGGLAISIVGTEVIGDLGRGTFLLSGGTNSMGSLTVGNAAGSNGSYFLSGTALLNVDDDLYVGYCGAGTLTQSGGTNSIGSFGYPYGHLYLGHNAGGSGTYNLTGGLLNAGSTEYIGSYGTGAFTQSGGTNTTPQSLILGGSAGGSGAYVLSDTGQLSTSYNQVVGSSGTGTFTQSGGTNTAYGYLSVGHDIGSGTYTLSNTGMLSESILYVGYSGTGTFAQSGGTNSVSLGGTSATNALYVGYNAGASGTYKLSGTGQLFAANEYIGYVSGATALFQQTGGTNSASFLTVGSTGQYVLSGGMLQINGGSIVNQGVFDGGSGPGLLTGANCIVDFSAGTLTNTAAMSVNMGANSLIILPAGFNLSTGFSTFTSSGVTHIAGGTLAVPDGKSFTGCDSLNDFVDCQGTITAAAGGAINLNNGITLSGNAAVNLGTGNLTVKDAASGISSGTLAAYNQFVGSPSGGTFTHSGGTNSPANGVWVGYNAGDNGTYNLSGTGNLCGGNLSVGYSGTGTFNQSGGTNSAGISLGYNAGALGTYNMTAGQLILSTEGQFQVGASGTAFFNQSGGVVSSDAGLEVGPNGTYTLSKTGQLTVGITITSSEEVDGTFIQSGGTNTPYEFFVAWLDSANYTLSGGTLSSSNQTIGVMGTATFTQTGGINNVKNGQLLLGEREPGSGIYNLSGGQLQAVRYELIGEDTGTSGTFNQSGGTNTVVDRLILADYAGTGSYNLSAGLLSVTGSLGAIVGGCGTGTFTQSGGSASINILTVGEIGPGTFNQTGGTTTVTSSVCLGQYPGSSGTYNLNGGTLILAALSGGSGTAAFNFGGGTLQPIGALSTSLPMTLTGIGGNANVDTAGYVVTLSGQLCGPGGLNKLGAGTLVLSGVNTYFGPTTVSAGALQSATAAALPNFGTSGMISVSPAATLVVNYGGTNDWAMADINMLRANGAFAPGSSLGFDTTNASGSVIFSNSIDGVMGLGKFGAGTLILSAVNTYTGPTTANGGVLDLQNQNALQSSTFAGGAGSLAFDSTVSGHAFVFGGLSGSTNLDLRDNATNPVALSVGNNAANTVYSGVLSGSGSLTKVGAGTLTLSGANTYSGLTAASAGVLYLKNQNSLQNSTFVGGPGSLVFASAVNSHAFNLGGLSGSSNVDLRDDAGNAVTLSVGNNGASTTYSGVLSGSGSLAKVGAGTLTLSNANNFTGGLTVSAGQLNIDDAQALGAGAFLIAGSGTIDNTTAGPLTLSTDNFITINTNLTFVGTQDLNLGNGAVSFFRGNHTMTVNANTLTLGGGISGNTVLTKAGAGRLVLAGASIYGGTTIVSAGTVSAANIIGSATGSSAVVVNSGATLSGSGIIGGPVSVAGTLAPGSGPGILTVNNQVTFQSTATFDAEVFGLTAGTGYDELTTTGPVSLAGSLALTFGSFTPSGSDVLFLINNTGTGATTGTFQYADNAEIGTFNGFNWYITYEANNVATPSLCGGNDVAIYSQPVPEPTTLALLAAGLLSLLASVWRKRR